MTTGTEFNDNLTNDPSIAHDQIDALGGDDVITIQKPTPTMNGGETVQVNAGSGSDTLIIDTSYTNLSSLSATGNDGSVIVRGGNGIFYQVFWTSIERLEITGRFFNANYTLGDEVDIVRLQAGFGGSINTGGNNDEIYILGGSGGARLRADGGAGNDLIDLTGITSGGGLPYEGSGGDGNDALRGSPYSDLLNGGAGNDNFSLYYAPASPKGGALFDTALGGSGGDNFFFGATLTSFDVVTGGADYDTLVVQGNYAAGLTLSANVTEIEALSLLAGTNTNFGESGANRYDYVITTNDANFAAGVQAKINGAALALGEDFTFNGSAETDASFVVYGSRNVDTLTGGFGNDIFFYAEERFAPGDTVNGGPGGYDGIFFRGNYTIDFNAPGYHGLLTSIENMTLSSATDERYARGGGTEFDYDIKLADAHLGAGVELTVSGTLLMATETMVLDGSLESDGRLRLFGGRADDILKGGGQADLIHGNLGADLLTGNGGADVFRYDSTAESASGSLDHILDFTPGSDKADLSRIDANSLAAGDQAFTWIGSNGFSHMAGELRIQDLNGTGWLLQGTPTATATPTSPSSSPSRAQSRSAPETSSSSVRTGPTFCSDFGPLSCCAPLGNLA
jgi:Ca2+-binding RTX toxin-like protein